MYDFGQLNVDTEDDYIAKIVHNHVSVFHLCCQKIQILQVFPE